jgi:endonuclease-8
MPEGPSIVLLKEEVQQFTGKKIIAVSGNSKIDQVRLLNQKIIAFKSWGKHFLICFKEFTLRIHFLMFGSYRVNEKKPAIPIRLNFTFKKGEVNFYSCSIKFLEGDINRQYNWSADVMNEDWNPKKAKSKLKQQPKAIVCDALLEQNEILYRIKVHPESLVKELPPIKLKKMINEARIYSFQFLEWKRKYELKKHWLAHTKKICLRCNHPIVKKYTGVKNRRSFICTNCQILYI